MSKRYLLQYIDTDSNHHHHHQQQQQQQEANTSLSRSSSCPVEDRMPGHVTARTTPPGECTAWQCHIWIRANLPWTRCRTSTLLGRANLRLAAISRIRRHRSAPERFRSLDRKHETDFTSTSRRNTFIQLTDICNTPCAGKYHFATYKQC